MISEGTYKKFEQNYYQMVKSVATGKLDAQNPDY